MIKKISKDGKDKIFLYVDCRKPGSSSVNQTHKAIIYAYSTKYPANKDIRYRLTASAWTPDHFVQMFEKSITSKNIKRASNRISQKLRSYEKDLASNLKKLKTDTRRWLEKV